GERELHLVHVARQSLHVLIDADEDERNVRIVLVFRVRRLQVRQLRTAGPSPGREKVQEQNFSAESSSVVGTAVDGRQRQFRQRLVDETLEIGGSAILAAASELGLEPRVEAALYVGLHGGERLRGALAERRGAAGQRQRVQIVFLRARRRI